MVLYIMYKDLNTWTEILGGGESQNDWSRWCKDSEGSKEYSVSKLRLEKQVGTILKIFSSNLKPTAKYTSV